MNPPVLTFDCYGTLIDWEAGIAAAFAREGARWGVRLDRAALLRAFAECEAEIEAGEYVPYREVLAAAARCAADRVGWALEPDRAGFLARSLPEWEPFPDTNPSLERLGAAFRLGILSNVDDALLERTLERLHGRWDLLVTAEQVRSYKPRRAHWVEARRRVGVAAGEWTHVAQSYYHDVRPCLELGLPVVWVNRGGRPLAPEEPRPDHEVASLSEAADLLLA